MSLAIAQKSDILSLPWKATEREFSFFTKLVVRTIKVRKMKPVVSAVLNSRVAFQGARRAGIVGTAGFFCLH